MDFNLDASLAVLSRTPHVVHSLLDGLCDTWTHANYGPNTWSAHEIVGHLIWGDRTDWLPRARHILEFARERPFAAFDRQGHVQLCSDHSLGELLDLFRDERAANLRALADLALTPEQLKAQGEHPALGTVTMAELLATWTVHDLNHIAQISKALAYQYKPAVGAWEAYLSVLAPPNPR